MKIEVRVFAFLLALGFLSGCVTKQSDDIQWKDPVVEAAFRDWLDKPTGPITPDELDGVTQVTVSGDRFFINDPPEVSFRDLPSGTRAYYPGGGTRTAIGPNASEMNTLSDFSNCRNLEYLQLRSTAFFDLAGVSDLSGLERLAGLVIAGDANLRDISGLSALNRLTLLELCSVAPDSFDVLGDMDGLNMLTLIDTNIADFTPVAAIKSLSVLYVERVTATDLTPLKELENLEIFYYAGQDGTIINTVEAIR